MGLLTTYKTTQTAFKRIDAFVRNAWINIQCKTVSGKILYLLFKFEIQGVSKVPFILTFETDEFLKMRFGTCH